MGLDTVFVMYTVHPMLSVCSNYNLRNVSVVKTEVYWVPFSSLINNSYAFTFLPFFCLLLHLLPMLSTLFPPTPLRRDQKVPWSVCTLGTRRSSSRGGRWALTSSWRGWRGTRRPLSASANAPWVTETATPLHRRAPHPRARFQQTWDQYVTRTVSHVTLFMHDDNQTESGDLQLVMHAFTQCSLSLLCSWHYEVGSNTLNSCSIVFTVWL